MYEISNTYLQSELDYRTDRLKAALRGQPEAARPADPRTPVVGPSDIVR